MNLEDHSISFVGTDGISPRHLCGICARRRGSFWVRIWWRFYWHLSKVLETFRWCNSYWAFSFNCKFTVHVNIDRWVACARKAIMFHNFILLFAAVDSSVLYDGIIRRIKQRQRSTTTSTPLPSTTSHDSVRKRSGNEVFIRYGWHWKWCFISSFVPTI